jgi:hypothetical protein
VLGNALLREAASGRFLCVSLASSCPGPASLQPLPPPGPCSHCLYFDHMNTKTWSTNTLSTLTSESAASRCTSPPFAIDEDRSFSSRSGLSSSSKGFRDGGPKEARLKRVAFLSPQKDVSNMHPVKVQNLPPKVSPEKIKAHFEKFGDVKDVYIPSSPKDRRLPAIDLAIVRFSSPHEARTAMSSPSSETGGLVVSPMSRQRSFFSGGTGYHGINNEPVEDGTYVRGMGPVKQDIELSSCLSRSGYPWGSIRELKVLSPHVPAEARDTYAIRIENLDRSVT